MRYAARAGLGFALLLFGAGLGARARKPAQDPYAVFRREIPKELRIEHALNRLTFGAAPGDLERVRSMGLKKWVGLQLHPERISEDRALETKLKALSTLSTSAGEMARDKTARQKVARDLLDAKLLRAIYSRRQLAEVLTDFWYNHFNVNLNKGPDLFFAGAYEREAIRAHVLGKFQDLLEASAKSPAMLFYLDNWQSAAAVVTPPRAARPQRRGLNENYGRELLELHTLGVNGGYTQKDVTEVARCFTGWTIRQPQLGGDFFFNPRMHDSGEKVVLGTTIPAGGGIEDGEKVLAILAHHPSTARFISRELAQRFVADDPPPALVDRMAAEFLHSGGDLLQVMKTMVESKEFRSAGAYRTKVKSPLELVAGAVRAVNGDVADAFNLANQVGRLGEPLYRKLEPTGYPNSGEAWLSSAALLARMNFALQLASNRIPGVKVQAATPTGIELGSPEFQMH